MTDYRQIAIDRTAFDRLRTSDSTQALPREIWPPFVEGMIQQDQDVQQVWGWPSGASEAVVEVIRAFVQSSGSTGWKRDRWYLVETSSTTVLMRGPDKDIEPTGPQDDLRYGHHGDGLPGWPVRSQRSS